MTEYRVNIPYARARYEEHSINGLRLKEAEMFDELNFIYGNNGFSETLAVEKLREHGVNNYLKALESILNEE